MKYMEAIGWLVLSAWVLMLGCTQANPTDVPYGTNAEPSSVGSSRDTGIFYNDGEKHGYVTRVENLFDSQVRRFGDPEVLERSTLTQVETGPLPNNNIQNFRGQEINLAPSEYGPAGVQGDVYDVRTRLDIRFLEIDENFLRDIGVDFRGLGSTATGIGGPGAHVDLDDVTNGLQDATSAGRDNAGAGLPTKAALNPSAGAYFGGSNSDRQRAVEDGLASLEHDYEVEIAQASTIVRRRKTTKPPRRTWKRSRVVPNTTRISVGDDHELPLEAMDISVTIDGSRARVVLDCFFRNDKDVQLAGNFQLRLPNGASPHYLSFGKTKLEKPAFTPSGVSAIADIREQRREIAEAPKEARMVPRETAANAYNETVRGRIDPALIEWAGAGVFRAQVFPLEPGALHHIVVAYDADLVRRGRHLVHRLDLPSGVSDLEVDLTARGGPVEVKPNVTPREGRYHFHNPAARSILTRIEAPGAVLLQGEDPGAGPLFSARLTPVLPEAEAKTKSRAVFLVDASLSSNPARFNAWLALMREILARNRPALREFAVAFFNVETFWWRQGFQRNTPENARDLEVFANTLSLEGATDLGQALGAVGGLEGAYDLFLLSDGAITWGDASLHRLGRRIDGHALFAYVAGAAGADLRALGHLARESGGAVFSVPSETAVARAAVAHRKRPWRLVRAAVAGGSDLLLAGRPPTLFPGQELSLAGRGRPTEGAAIELTLEQDGITRTVATALPTRIESRLARRAYGQIAVEQLEGLGHSAAEEAKAYASHFRVVGSSCSLLMLESDAAYEGFDIRPEDDAAKVKARPASEAVAAALDETAEILGDPKRALLARLEQLERLGILDEQGAKAIHDAVSEMPVEAFRVDAAPLTTKLRYRGDKPASLLEALARRRFTYDTVTSDALRRRRAAGPADGLKALSSLVEHQPGDLVLARDVAFTALSWGLEDQAYHLLARVADRRPYELPTFLAIASCLAQMDRTDAAIAFYEIGIRGTHDRYGALAEIASLEYTRLLRDIVSGRRTSSVSGFAGNRLKEIAAASKLTSADLVIVMRWNTDRTDVDLHVTDPTGERCCYQHTQTKIGGRITSDVTQGLGPEMFVLEKAIPGAYRAEVRYYSSDASRTKARSKVHVTLYENFGKPGERVTRRTVELKGTGDHELVATVRR